MSRILVPGLSAPITKLGEFPFAHIPERRRVLLDASASIRVAVRDGVSDDTAARNFRTNAAVRNELSHTYINGVRFDLTVEARSSQSMRDAARGIAGNCCWRLRMPKCR